MLQLKLGSPSIEIWSQRLLFCKWDSFQKSLTERDFFQPIKWQEIWKLSLCSVKNMLRAKINAQMKAEQWLGIELIFQCFSLHLNFSFQWSQVMVLPNKLKTCFSGKDFRVTNHVFVASDPEFFYPAVASICGKKSLLESSWILKAYSCSNWKKSKKCP